MMVHQKLLFIVTEDWYFVSHRLPLAAAAKKAGYDVAVATRVRSHGQAITAEGIRLIPFILSRHVGYPIREVVALTRLYVRERPDIVHHVALKPIVYGVLAARIAGVRAQVNAVAGMGRLFTSTTGVMRLIRPAARWILALLLRGRRSLTIVQNSDDRALLLRSHLPESRIHLIRGAGVDTTLFAPGSEPAQPIRIVLAARMLWAKGVREFVQAASLLAEEGIVARFILAGLPDYGNPESVPEETLREWDGKNGVEWRGLCNDMPSVFRESHVSCLPSYYGEGVPKALLEAAASGLPIVTTDIPGCREIVRNDENGILVPAKNPHALATALRRLIQDPSLRSKMGQCGRAMVLDKFSQERVIKETLAAYRELAT